MYKKRTKVCKYCWKSFEANYPKKEYCDRECRKKGTKLSKTICANCGGEFSPKSKSAKYCSILCSKEWHKKLKILPCPVCWKEFKQHNQTTQFCSRECANIAQTSKDIKCPICWKEFHPRTRQKYCSNKCLWKSKIKLDDKSCEFCWKIFHPKNATQKFCSKVCWYNNRIILHDKKCKLCGNSFKPFYKEQKYCSNKCAKLINPISDIKCEICGEIFHPTYRYAKYCSIECRWIWHSRYIASLSEEEKNARMYPLHNASPKPISSNNIKFAKFLNENGFETSMEFFINWRPFDIKTGDTLIEINPNTYHNSTEAPKGTPKWRSYHQDKAKLAINHWYNIIMVWDWDNKQDILKLLNGLNYGADEIRIWLDKCMYADIIKLWYKLSDLSQPVAHRYNPKTKEHIIDIDDDMCDMVESWFVKIYDCWIATFT